MGLDSGSPGSHPGLKAAAKLLSHWGCPELSSVKRMCLKIPQGLQGTWTRSSVIPGSRGQDTGNPPGVGIAAQRGVETG